MSVEWIDMGLEELLPRMNLLDKSRVQVGIVGAAAERSSANGDLTMAELALIQELGTETIPPRPFIHPALHTTAAQEEAAKIAHAGVFFENLDLALDHAGERLAQQMRDTILHGHLEPNAPETVRRKGFDQPLIETTGLVDAIGYQIVREGGGVLGAGAAIGDFEEFTVEGGE
jgi:hypothetical protein